MKKKSQAHPRTNQAFKQAGLLVAVEIDGEIIPKHLDKALSTKPSLDDYDLCPAEANYGDRVHYTKLLENKEEDNYGS